MAITFCVNAKPARMHIEMDLVGDDVTCLKMFNGSIASLHDEINTARNRGVHIKQ